nr:MAG TPA: hypothetical protein [Bacteriophage sp.]
MGPFSYAENKAGCDGLLAVLAVEVGVVGLESLTVKPAAADVLPGGFPAVSLDGFLSPLRHGGFELIGQGFGLCLQLRNHGPDAHKVMGGGVQFVGTHSSFLLVILRDWRIIERASGPFPVHLSQPPEIEERPSGPCTRPPVASLVPCYGLIIHCTMYFVY